MKKSKISTYSIGEVGAWVAEHLRSKGLDCFLSGGAVVSIYTDNRYESFDLDFVTFSERSKIDLAMTELGFDHSKSRYYIHPETKYYVEFPGSALQIGNSLIRSFSEHKTKVGTLKLLTPTDCVKDRLASFFHWNDRQGLDQAVWVAEAQVIDLEDIEKWSKDERKQKEFEEFLARLKKE